MRPPTYGLRRCAQVLVVCTMLIAGCSAGDDTVAVSPTAVAPTVEAASASIVRIAAFGCGAPALGSGFAVAPDLIVTSGHLITGRTPEETRVVRPDGGEYVAELVAFDADLDLALLRVSEPVFEPVTLLRDVAEGTDGIAFAVRGADEVDEIDFEVDAPVIVNWDGVFRDTESTFHGVRLNAEIERGDSGSGLFIGENEVVGLVHSTNRRGIPRGYAVSARQIDDWLDVVPADDPVLAPRCT